MLHTNCARELQVNQDFHTECCTLINRVWEPHVNQDLFISHTVSQRESSKFHLKIPVCESQHCLQSNLSQTHSYHGMKRPNKQRNSNLWEVCFSSAAVVSKLLLGCWGHFLYILYHYNPTAHSSNMHTSRVATENCMKCGFSYETDCCRNYCEESFWTNLDILCRCTSLTMVDLTECCMLTVHGSHTLIKIPILNAIH